MGVLFAVAHILRNAGWPDHVIDHFDKIADALDPDEIETYYTAKEFIVVYNIGSCKVPLRVPNNTPPEILTDKLRKDLTQGIRAEMADEERRKKAILEFSGGAIIQSPHIETKH